MGLRGIVSKKDTVINLSFFLRKDSLLSLFLMNRQAKISLSTEFYKNGSTLGKLYLEI